MEQIQVREYDLPDSYLYKKNIDATSVKVWIPKKTCLVLGRSNDPEGSLHIQNIISDNIPVYKRPSGGETVILTPSTVVISIVFQQANFRGGRSYFDIINNRIKILLEELGIKNVELEGISDIALNDVKILGSALYQNKEVVFYHAVLNISESAELMERYIKHPTREPDYRKNRKHREFVTSLAKEKYEVNKMELITILEKGLQEIRLSST